MTASAAALKGESPWRCLNALGFDSEADRELLRLTRGAELKVVTSLVSSSKASVIYAYSGNGKSSLINAGLIPNMLEAEYVVFRTRPRPPFAVEHPAQAFKECMLRDVWIPALNPEDRRLPEELQKGIGVLPFEAGTRLAVLLERFASQWTRIATPEVLRRSYLERMGGQERSAAIAFHHGDATIFGEDMHLLFICDQFEELFVHYLNQTALQEFVS
jgi:hypothetical protein